MAFLKIGKPEHRDKLTRVRNRLLERGKKESEKDAPSSYAAAAEIAISAVFEDVPDLVCDAFEVLDNPPSTWERYMAMHNGKAIYEMEFGELREAIKRDIQSDRAELHVHKEMTHVLAAAMYMYLVDND